MQLFFEFSLRNLKRLKSHLCFKALINKEPLQHVAATRQKFDEAVAQSQEKRGRERQSECKREIWREKNIIKILFSYKISKVI